MMSPFHCLCLTVLLALIARLMCVCVIRSFPWLLHLPITWQCKPFCFEFFH